MTPHEPKPSDQPAGVFEPSVNRAELAKNPDIAEAYKIVDDIYRQSTEALGITGNPNIEMITVTSGGRGSSGVEMWKNFRNPEVPNNDYQYGVRVGGVGGLSAFMSPEYARKDYFSKDDVDSKNLARILVALKKSTTRDKQDLQVTATMTNKLLQ